MYLVLHIPGLLLFYKTQKMYSYQITGYRYKKITRVEIQIQNNYQGRGTDTKQLPG